jgi:tetratricopeptide (TPR) repeat protein
MSENEKHEGCNCSHEKSDAELLTGQAEAKVNLAVMWLHKDRHDAAEIHMAAASKLLALSGETESAGWAAYYIARIAIAQSHGHKKAAMKHARKAFAISKKVHSADTYHVPLAQANFGECLAEIGNRTGLIILAEAMVNLKAVDVGDAPHMISWKEATLKEMAETLERLS